MCSTITIGTVASTAEFATIIADVTEARDATAHAPLLVERVLDDSSKRAVDPGRERADEA